MSNFTCFSAKDEGLCACAQTRVRRRIFSLFPMMVASQVMRSTTKNQFCFLALIRCLVKFVVLQSHSQSICVLNQCHIKINTHLLYFLPFPFIFYPHEICLIVVSVFIQLTYNNTWRNVFLKERKSNWNTKAFLPQKKNLQSAINNKKANSLPVSNFSFECSKFAST